MKIIRVGHKICFTVYFHQHPEFAAGVNICFHFTFIGFTSNTLGCFGNPLFSEDLSRLLGVPFGVPTATDRRFRRRRGCEKQADPMVGPRNTPRVGLIIFGWTSCTDTV